MAADRKTTYREYAFHHVFWPPKRPQSSDELEGKEHTYQLLQDVIQALHELKDLWSDDDKTEQWALCAEMMRGLYRSRISANSLDESALAEDFSGLSKGQGAVAVEVRAQNAGIMIHKLTDGDPILETFELLAPSADVMGSVGRLARSFAGPGIIIATERLEDANFCAFLAASIAMLDGQSFENATPAIVKAGSSLPEIRDTVHPMYVTHLLASVMDALGDRATVTPIQKHIRDDVLWSATDRPWRRSPTWLLIRVALQRVLMKEKPGPLAHTAFKIFMVYFMATLLRRANDASLEDKFMMRAKIVHRLQKLDPNCDEKWYLSIQRTIEEDHRRHLNIWDSRQNSPDLFGVWGSWTGVPKNYKDETNLSLKRLRKHLAGIRSREHTLSRAPKFVPPEFSRVSASPHCLPSADHARKILKDMQHIWLFDVEEWVRVNLDAWSSTSRSPKEASASLSSLLKIYIETALSTYSESADSFSLMCLTTMELWTALDRIVAQEHDLLHDHPTGFPGGFLDQLLLPRKSQLIRLQNVEAYLRRRNGNAQDDLPSPLHEMNDKNALGVRYYEKSAMHQNLHAKIDAKAREERNEKIAELAESTRRYNDLLQQAEARNCDRHEYIDRRGNQVSMHLASCGKCKLKARAENMEIEVHEWPLPQASTHLKAVIFELVVPDSIFYWRDITYFVRKMIFCHRKKDLKQNYGKNIYFLAKYHPLRQDFQSSQGLLGAGSVFKPFVESHYKRQKVSVASESSVCVKHGMEYQFYDTESRMALMDLTGPFDIRSACTLHVPAGPYDNLKDTMMDTQHTSNAVQARQVDCSHELSLHEHEAYGEMRSGENLQLYNIVRELAMPVLDMSRIEVSSLMLQTVWQAGSSDNQVTLRKAHVPLADEIFVSDMIESLEVAVQRYEGNWQRWNAMYVLAILTQRVLSTTPLEKVSERAIALLRRVRSSSLGWVRDLVQDRLRAADDERRTAIDTHILKSALVCHITFDCENTQTADMFVNDEDFAIYCELLITINDHLPAKSDISSHLWHLLMRAFRVIHSLEDLVQSTLLQNATGLNTAVKRIWPAFSAHKWRATGTSWLEIRCEGHVCNQTVHFNLLNGTLLVNGAPISRPPIRILEDPSYQELFGKNIIDVIPSSEPGMQFECRADVHGHRVHFGLLNDELVIRAQNADDTLELIPKRHLTGDFPHHLVIDYVHWISMETWTVAWRPKDQPWSSYPPSWLLVPEQGDYTLQQEGTRGVRLVDVGASTSKAVYQLLDGLDRPQNIQICRILDSGDLEVTLPRFQLDFYGRSGARTLSSRQYPGMLIDQVQSFGTCTGLRSKLVLCSSDSVVRKVIVPYGNVRHQCIGEKVEVNVSSKDKRMKYFVYTVDTCLGRLKGHDSTASRLYLAYLHAITSTSLEDRLTGMTGTEHALSLLSEPAIHSVMSPYDGVEIELLARIAAISPKRRYYPEHLCVMQEIEWSELLPVLSQHYSFGEIVHNIRGDIAVMKPFHKSTPTAAVRLQQAGQKPLDQMAALHEAAFRINSQETGLHIQDAIYNGRECDKEPISGLKRAMQLCKLVDCASVRLRPSRDLLKVLIQWRALNGRDFEAQSFNHVALGSQWLRNPIEMLPKMWFRMQYQLAQSPQENTKYYLMFLVSMLVTNTKVVAEWLETLIAFSTVADLRQRIPPSCKFWDLSDGFEPSHARVLQLAETHAIDFHSSPEFRLDRRPMESNYAYNERKRKTFRAALENCCHSLASAFVDQWPCLGSQIETPCLSGHSYVDTGSMMPQIRQLFDSWYRNRELKSYLRDLQPTLTSLSSGARYKPRPGHIYQQNTAHNPSFQQPMHVSLRGLLAGNAPSLSSFHFSQLDQALDFESVHENPEAVRQLASEHEIDRYNGIHEWSQINLQASVLALGEVTENRPRGQQPPHFLQLLKDYVASSLADSRDKLSKIRDALLDNASPIQKFAIKCQMGPRTGTNRLLKLLSVMHRAHLSETWKEALVKFGLTLTSMQQAARFLGSHEEFMTISREWHDGSHTNWSPEEYPDWLLFELETEKIIRSTQAEIAMEMLRVRGDDGSIFQLNMGEGKTSVIIPLVAMSMHSTSCLARVVVLKQLAPSMMSNLATCLGGLAGRKIRCFPFSRSVQLSTSDIAALQNQLQLSLSSGEIWLAQPEHVLSFELYGIDNVLRGHASEGTGAINLQRWIDSNVRNILDESDEILDPRHELIYTAGSQRSIDLGSMRWSLIVEVLDFIGLATLSPITSSLVEVNRGQDNAFPFLQITRKPDGEKFLEQVLAQVLLTGLTMLPLQRLSHAQRSDLRLFLMARNPLETLTAKVERFFESDPNSYGSILLLRGLFCDALLMFIFHRHRWRVSYGLAPWRSSLAVPYQAKDQPSLRSEFSHPDVTMTLTSLSYLYKGLTEPELRRCFSTLERIDNPEDEYRLWIKSCPVTEPAIPTDLSGVNLENYAQWSKAVLPSLAKSKEVVKFHLCYHVFPHAMREFPHKLAVSGWNLGKRSTHPTTGFSGTNDGRTLLPASIRQIDLPNQKHTNALVLQNLLQTENVVHLLPQPPAPKSQTLHILETISSMQPSVQVLLDVGAQMLDMDNKTVARTWLRLQCDQNIKAAIFFDDGDRPCYIDRENFVAPLQGSPFADTLQICVFYLDDTHTRGVDFQFPLGFRAAVTVAPRLVKDRLCQASMRMRQLGHGHSIVILVHKDVLDSVREIWPELRQRDLSIGNIIRWTIRQTYDNTQRLLPLWVNQGIQFRNFSSRLSHVHGAGDNDIMKIAAQALLQDEAKTVRQRYEPGMSSLEEIPSMLVELSQSKWRDAQHICDTWETFHGQSLEVNGLEEEQERELSPESEQERQIERPPAAKPLQHHLHPDVRKFVSTGQVIQGSNAFQRCFSTDLFRREPFSELMRLPKAIDIVVTADFARSVEGDDQPGSEHFKKSVRWILRSSTDTTWVILSSFEANELLPGIRTSRYVQLSIFAARTSMTNRTLEDLTFCRVPSAQTLASPSLSGKILLSVFAGQTCFAGTLEYQQFCRLFGLYHGDQAPSKVELDGFIEKEYRKEYDEAMDLYCPFSSSPVHWIHQVMMMRRKGQPYGNSHVGLVVKGRVLQSDRDWPME